MRRVRGDSDAASAMVDVMLDWSKGPQRFAEDSNGVRGVSPRTARVYVRKARNVLPADQLGLTAVCSL